MKNGRLCCPCNACYSNRQFLESARRQARDWRKKASQAGTAQDMATCLRTAEQFSQVQSWFVPEVCLRAKPPATVGSALPRGPLSDRFTKEIA